MGGTPDLIREWRRRRQMRGLLSECLHRTSNLPFLPLSSPRVGEIPRGLLRCLVPSSHDLCTFCPPRAWILRSAKLLLNELFQDHFGKSGTANTACELQKHHPMCTLRMAPCSTRGPCARLRAVVLRALLLLPAIKT